MRNRKEQAFCGGRECACVCACTRTCAWGGGGSTVVEGLGPDLLGHEIMLWSLDFILKAQVPLKAHKLGGDLIRFP